jgi:hypothetical protein
VFARSPGLRSNAEKPFEGLRTGVLRAASRQRQDDGSTETRLRRDCCAKVPGLRARFAIACLANGARVVHRPDSKQSTIESLGDKGGGARQARLATAVASHRLGLVTVSFASPEC